MTDQILVGAKRERQGILTIGFKIAQGQHLMTAIPLSHHRQLDFTLNRMQKGMRRNEDQAVEKLVRSRPNDGEPLDSEVARNPGGCYKAPVKIQAFTQGEQLPFHGTQTSERSLMRQRIETQKLRITGNPLAEKRLCRCQRMDFSMEACHSADTVELVITGLDLPQPVGPEYQPPCEKNASCTDQPDLAQVPGG